MLCRLTCLMLTALLLAGLPHGFAGAAPASLDDYMALTGPEPSRHIAYGPAPSQYAELFAPSGPGPFPVVVLVHGGCWSLKFGGIRQMRNLAAALTAQGIAVWNVEYRRVDEPGGGYPGTYQDIGAAFDRLTADAASWHLDRSHLLAIGHSAGGHLVQWLAGRNRLPPSSPLYRAHAAAPRQVISLGGLADLRRQADRIKSICEVDVAQLTGPESAGRADIYADTSPAELVPNGSHTLLINGELDHVSPPAVASDYAERARLAGDDVDLLVLPGASHFDEVSADSPSWSLILPRIRAALALPPLQR